MQAVTVELPEELVEGLEGIAEETDKTRSRVARELLDEWLERRS